MTIFDALAKKFKAEKIAQTLIEGVPIRGKMSNILDEDNYKIEIKQVEGFEKPIKIQISPLQGSVKMIVRHGEEATRLNYTWTSSDNVLVIDPKSDKNFKREGTYFVKLLPKPTFWETFALNLQFQYLISYFTEDSYLYLKSSLPLEVKQKAGNSSYTYFRHFISTFNKDLSLSLTVFSGSPTLYATFDPEYKWPNRSTPSTFSSRN